jgi:aminoglycoside phosphotransferase family enzyme
MSEHDRILEQLKRRRDELKLQMHLAGKDVSDDWQGLERKLKHFAEKAELQRSGDEVGNAVRSLGRELKDGYERVRRALKDPASTD